MPSITINGTKCEFTPGQMILQVANANSINIPQYCYHDGLSIVASCRICLGECWAPNPKTGKVEPFMGGKLLPTCQTAAADGMVVYTDSPKAVQNQKAVMEYLLINHPLDCPVCDQAGECLLQDYSYEYGRGVSRFEDVKVKQPKKDVGPHVLLYSDRCILCSRCVRFTREITGTAELMIAGRGNKSEIDVFPGAPLDNELSANVVDLCPVGALLDKDFLFAQRVWFLKSTPSIDPLTPSGDNIFIEHNEGKVYRIKPRTNLAINKWWITDEVRYGWKFVHSDDRLTTPMRRQFGALVPSDPARAYDLAAEGLRSAVESGGRLAVLVSPMLTCEDAYSLATAAREIDPQAILAVGPIPRRGEDKTFPPEPKASTDSAGGTGASAPAAVPAPAVKTEGGFRVYAEKAPNARGVRRVLEAVTGGRVPAYEEFLDALRHGGGGGAGRIGAVILTGNYPGPWADDDMARLVSRARDDGGGRRFVVLIDTLGSRLVDDADVVLPSCTWAEKAGTFENARGILQAFEAAILPLEGSAAEGQIAANLARAARGGSDGPSGPDGLSGPGATYTASVRGAERTRGSIPGITGEPASGGQADQSEGGPVSLDVVQVLHTSSSAAATRKQMAAAHPALGVFVTDIKLPEGLEAVEGDMAVVEL